MSPTHVAWASLPVWIAGTDYLLIRRGHPTMSAVARRNRVLTGVLSTLLIAHLLGSFKYDPLTWLAQRLGADI